MLSTIKYVLVAVAGTVAAASAILLGAPMSYASPEMADGAVEVAVAYADVPATFWAHEAIMKWSSGESPLLLGDGAGRFMPDEALKQRDLRIVLNKARGNPDVAWHDSEAVSREEAMSLIAWALDIEPSVDSVPAYTDAASIDERYAPYIGAMLKSGLLNPSGKGNGVFDPKAPLTRAEFVTVAQRGISAIVDADVSGQSFDESVIVRRPGVELADVIIGGDLLIAEGASSGTVSLSGVIVRGRTVVLGGGELNIDRSVPGQVFIKTPDLVTVNTNNRGVAISVAGGASVATNGDFGLVSLYGPMSKLAVLSGYVGDVVAEREADGSVVEIGGDSIVGELTADCPSEIAVEEGCTVYGLVINSDGVDVKGSGALGVNLIVGQAVSGTVEIPFQVASVVNNSAEATVELPKTAYEVDESRRVNLPNDIKWTFTTINGATINQDTYKGKTIALIFLRGNGRCGLSNAAMTALNDADWTRDEDIAVIAVDADDTDAETLRAFKDEYAPDNDRVILAYGGNGAMWSYVGKIAAGESSITFTVNVVIGPDNDIGFYWDGGGGESIEEYPAYLDDLMRE